MKIVMLSLGLLVLCAPSAMAVGEQDPNMVGFYFDTTPVGCEFAAWADPFEEIQVHLVLTNPTMSEIRGWEAGFDISGSALAGEPLLYQGGINSLSDRNFSITYPFPIPSAGTTLLASIPLVPVDVFLNCIRLFGLEAPSVPGDLPVLYLCAGAFLQVETSVFAGSDASAQLNGDIPVIGSPWPCGDPTPISELSWGAVKGLYR